MADKFYLLACLIGIMMLAACSQTVHINKEEDPQSSGVVISEDGEKQEMSQVRILFNLTAEFPSGGIRPDIVYMDGKIISDNTLVKTGPHAFIIEKKGYQQKTAQLVVKNEEEGTYSLNLKLIPKERIVRFDISDKTTMQPIDPDKVVISPLPEGDSMTIGDKAFVKPGRKKLVIQKSGYKPITRDITIQPEEEPYFIHCELTPEK